MLTTLFRRGTSVGHSRRAFASLSKFRLGGALGDDWSHGREELRPSGSNSMNPEETHHDVFQEPSHKDHGRGAPQKNVEERGKTWVHGIDRNHHLGQLFPYLGDQYDLPWTSRSKMNVYSNYDYLLRMEYFFFGGPAFLVCGVLIPAFSLIYSIDDTVDCEMVVKVVGRQWFWIYEVESPVGEDDDEE